MRKKIFRNNQGAAMAEVAVVIPLFIGILMVIIEFGTVLYISNSINQIARSAARYAALAPSYTSSSLLTQAGASSVLDITKITLTVSPDSTDSRNIGDEITVMVSYNYTPIVNPFVFFGGNNSWSPTISSSAHALSQVKKYP